MATNDGGSAFPLQCHLGFHPHGMSLRDYFAAVALPPFIARYGSLPAATVMAYEIADAMLRAREAKSPRETADAHIADWGRK